MEMTSDFLTLLDLYFLFLLHIGTMSYSFDTACMLCIVKFRNQVELDGHLGDTYCMYMYVHTVA